MYISNAHQVHLCTGILNFIVYVDDLILFSWRHWKSRRNSIPTRVIVYAPTTDGNPYSTGYLILRSKKQCNKNARLWSPKNTEIHHAGPPLQEWKGPLSHKGEAPTPSSGLAAETRWWSPVVLCFSFLGSERVYIQVSPSTYLHWTFEVFVDDSFFLVIDGI